MSWLAAFLIATLLGMPQSTPTDEKAAGDMAAAAGRFDEAGKHYESFARESPSEENLFFLGSFLLNHNGYESARKLFAFASGKYPQSARLMVGLGISEYSLGSYDQAVRTLCAAVDLDPGDSRAFQFLGKMQDVSAAYADEVRKRLGNFAGLFPDSAFANYYYALSLLNRTAGGERQESAGERYLRRTLNLDPSMTDAHFELGVLLADTDRTDEAISELKLAIRQQPELLKAHYRLGQLYRKNKQEKQAREQFDFVQRLTQTSAIAGRPVH